MEILTFFIVLFMSIWLITLAGAALHETLASPGENYNRFVKYLAGMSIGVSAIALGVSFYLFHQGSG